MLVVGGCGFVRFARTTICYFIPHFRDTLRETCSVAMDTRPATVYRFPFSARAAPVVHSGLAVLLPQCSPFLLACLVILSILILPI